MDWKILLPILLFAGLFWLPIANAQSIYLAPETHEVISGDTFTVTLNAESLSDLFGIEANIGYPADLLSFQNVQNNSFLSEDDKVLLLSVPPDNTTLGNLDKWAIARTGDEGVSGGGIIGSINFSVIGSGLVTLTLNSIKLVDSQDNLIILPGTGSGQNPDPNPGLDPIPDPVTNPNLHLLGILQSAQVGEVEEVVQKLIFVRILLATGKMD